MHNKQELNTLFHCTFYLNYHLVIVTKYRRKCITAPMLKKLNLIAENLLERWNGKLIEFNGEQDHIHLLLALNPKVAPSTFVNNFKTVTSRLIRKEFGIYLQHFYKDKPVFWSRSYCILTCGGAPLSILKQYIQQQDAPV